MAAKKKGQEAANRARSGGANRKSGKSTPTSRKLKELKKTVTSKSTYIDSAKNALAMGGLGAAGRVGRAFRYNQGRAVSDTFKARPFTSMTKKDILRSERGTSARMAAKGKITDRTVKGAREYGSGLRRDDISTSYRKIDMSRPMPSNAKTRQGGTRTRGSKAAKKKSK